ncbi:hypothetical protein V1522DRAFT_412528 [Lipomyces starkeyi]
MPLASLPNVTLVELNADNLATIDSAVAEIEKIAPEGIDEFWNVRACAMSVCFIWLMEIEPGGIQPRSEWNLCPHDRPNRCAENLPN